MQGRGGGRNPFFDLGDPFSGFGNFGSFGGHRSLVSNIFGGRNPFDDPFFSRPFGGMFESNHFGPSGNPFADMHASGFLEHQTPAPKRSRGPIIEEINSDDEKEADEDKNENPRKLGRLTNKPSFEEPEDDVEERKDQQLQYRNDYRTVNDMQPQPQARSFTFQSSTVSYGGPNGAYYTSSRTRRAGSDGVMFEESKEADAARRQATHKISKGLHNKGHTVARKLNSDGKVDTMQTLHNINEDELTGFQQAWEGNARRHLPGWTESFNGHENMGAGSSGQSRSSVRGGWALPSTEPSLSAGALAPDTGDRVAFAGSQHSGRYNRDGEGFSGSQHSGRYNRDGEGFSGSQHPGKMKADVKDRTGHARGGGRGRG